MILRIVLLALIGSLLLPACAPKPSPTVSRTSSTAPVSLASMETSILQEVNKHRASKGLAPLKESTIIDTEAALHSQQMASKQVPFGHDGYEKRIARIDQRLGGAGSSAENVAYGNLSAREVVQSWLKSPGHKKNIEGRYNLTGIGVSRSKQGVIYYTQIFTQK